MSARGEKLSTTPMGMAASVFLRCLACSFFISIDSCGGNITGAGCIEKGIMGGPKRPMARWDIACWNAAGSCAGFGVGKCKDAACTSSPRPPTGRVPEPPPNNCRGELNSEGFNVGKLGRTGRPGAAPAAAGVLDDAGAVPAAAAAAVAAAAAAATTDAAFVGAVALAAFAAAATAAAAAAAATAGAVTADGSAPAAGAVAFVVGATVEAIFAKSPRGATPVVAGAPPIGSAGGDVVATGGVVAAAAGVVVAAAAAVTGAAEGATGGPAGVPSDIFEAEEMVDLYALLCNETCFVCARLFVRPQDERDRGRMNGRRL